MGSKDLVEIKAGNELDTAVADAIGLKCMYRVLGGDSFFVDTSGGTGSVPMFFRPSVDLNAAFFAAKKFGLFTDWSLGFNGVEWFLVSEADSTSDGSQLVSAGTPALAICAAILGLSNRILLADPWLKTEDGKDWLSDQSR